MAILLGFHVLLVLLLVAAIIFSIRKGV